MAYVNMTVDGQTKRTDSLNLVGADGESKTAILSAILEASDQQGGSTPSSGGVESGTYTPSNRQKSFTLPVTSQKSHLVMMPANFASINLTLGVAFATMICADENRTYGYYSNNAGSNTDGSSGSQPNNAETKNYIRVSYGATEITVYNPYANGNATDRLLQDGLVYNWFAW